MSIENEFVQIDDEGFPHFNGVRVTDPNIGREILSQVKLNDKSIFMTTVAGRETIVEAFDQPFVATSVEVSASGEWSISLPYFLQLKFKIDELYVDEWDRFLGYDLEGRPFVFSRPAQAQFFNLLDDSDEDWFEFAGKRYQLKAWLTPNPNSLESQFWTDIYNAEGKPGWEMDAPTPVLVEALKQLKLPRCRILVLGCGSGNDAAFLAEKGHLVTAVDFSSEAISRAKEKYGSVANLNFLQADAFKLPEHFRKNFDLVFEHTCFCAIPPEKREDLLKVWRNCLEDKGHLLAILFVMEKKAAPPYGGTEWEYRQRLQKKFHFLYWTRAKNSMPMRLGRELVIYAQKKEG